MNDDDTRETMDQIATLRALLGRNASAVVLARDGTAVALNRRACGQLTDLIPDAPADAVVKDVGYDRQDLRRMLIGVARINVEVNRRLGSRPSTQILMWAQQPIDDLDDYQLPGQQQRRKWWRRGQP
ncbi:hypothetical protein [Demequina sp. NBRC 110054]|uniref:hypothetical protein n=1 Tax=Demequina sp. NBRC 110054 TaxID=1570343 RepID=UPI000A07614A|nr:hypothetical protein [Demequina sp. NBRC 110054]